VLNLESKQLEAGKITKLYVTRGVSKSEVTSAGAGTI
jgi:predicted membrane GTPase involved in stress response